MNHVRGLTSTGQALHQVFLNSIEHYPSLAQQHASPLRSSYQLRQRRHAITGYRSRDPDFGKNPTLARNFGPRGSSFPVVDEAIPGPEVRVVDTAKRIGEPQDLQQVLRSFDRKQNFLVQVSPPNYDQLAVCKITERKEVFAHQAEVEKRTKKPKNTPKRIELGWHVDSGDLGHKMDKLKQFLEEGRKVEVEVHTKKRKQPVTPDVAASVLRRIRERVDEVKGAQESKPMIGSVGKLVTLFLEGKPS